ncbi:MAG: dienelactone hydrolase family protein [Acidimicrobiales bacterium]
MTTLTAADGHTFDAYETGEGSKGIVVVQEIFGVNPHIRSVADRAAQAGYRAIAPAFFDRVERGVELDATTATA